VAVGKAPCSIKDPVKLRKVAPYGIGGRQGHGPWRTPCGVRRPERLDHTLARAPAGHFGETRHYRGIDRETSEMMHAPTWGDRLGEHPPTAHNAVHASGSTSTDVSDILFGTARPLPVNMGVLRKIR
jgi:hypothetical protein